MPSKILTRIAAALLLATGASLAVAEDVTLDVVTEAWKRTQQKVHSGTYHWETRQWLAKGSRTAPGSSNVVPEDDVIHTHDCRLSFSGGRVRYESKGPDWDPDQDTYVDRRTVYTWDSTKATSYNGNADAPYAFVHGVNKQLFDSSVRPIQFAYRMFHPEWYIFNAEKYEIAPGTEIVDGLLCKNIETAPALLRQKLQRGSKPLKAVYSVCPDRDHAVVRYAAINAATGAPTLEIAIKQVFNEKFSVWSPSEWTITHYGASGPFESETSKVLGYSLNEPVPEEQFVAALPAGTIISDLRNAAGAGAQDYILRANGEKRLVTRDEILRNATREQLIATDPGSAGLRRSEAGGIFSSPVTFVWIGGILLLLVAAGLAFRNQIRA